MGGVASPSSMMKKLGGVVALITGASGEIGSATAIEFAREGASGLALHYRHNLRKAQRVAKEAGKLGCRTLLLRANLADAVEAKRLVRDTVAAFRRLDALVCIAGHPFSREDWFGRFEDLTPEQLRNPLDVDLLGSSYVIQAAVPVMKKRHGGKIVLIGSTPAITGDAVGISYLVAKAGILALTRALAQYLGPYNIHVNALALGAIDTKATTARLTARQKEELTQEASLRRFGAPLEVARKVVFLAGKDSDFMTGQTLVADGGYAMR